MSAWPLSLPVEIASGKCLKWRLPATVALAFACAACQPTPRSPDRPEALATQVIVTEETAVQTSPEPPLEVAPDSPQVEAMLPQGPQSQPPPSEEPLPGDPGSAAVDSPPAADLTGELSPEERPPEEEPLADAGPALPWEFAAEPPNLLSRPVPVFPDWADFEEIIGAEARFRIWLDAEGRVTRAELVEASVEIVVEPAREALLASRYLPVVTPDGFPVAVSFEETLQF